jgi:hypothetical protein
MTKGHGLGEVQVVERIDGLVHAWNFVYYKFLIYI